MHVWVEVKNLAALADIETYLEETIDPERRSMLIRWKKEILQEIPEQSEILNRYSRLKKITKDPIIPVKLEQSSSYDPSAYSVPCPGCFVNLPTADVCHLHSMDVPVFCQRCYRILYSDGCFLHIWKLTQKEIDSHEISLPAGLDLGENPTFRDRFGKNIVVTVDNGILRGLEDVFSSCALKEGDELKLRVLSLQDNEYAFVPRTFKTDVKLEDFSFEEIQEILDERSKVLGRGITLADTIREGRINLETLPRRHTVTLTDDCISRGVLKIPAYLASSLGESQTIATELRPLGVDELDWEPSGRELKGISEWYILETLEPGDKVNIKLESKDPISLSIWTEWKRSLNELLKLPPEDLVWQDLPIRSCLILVLRRLDRAAHYRELYAGISRHRTLSVGSILGTLSKYRNTLFSHEGKGLWALLDDSSQEIEKLRREAADISEEDVDWERVWAVVEEIEATDLVFKTLEHRREPLSFQEICEILGSRLGIEAELLKQTGFLNAEDDRLQRIDTGDWALKKWFQLPEEDKEETVRVEKPPTREEDILSLTKSKQPYLWLVFFGLIGLLLLLIFL